MLLGAVSHPADDAPTQDALDCAGVKVPKHLERELKTLRHLRRSTISSLL